MDQLERDISDLHSQPPQEVIRLTSLHAVAAAVSLSAAIVFFCNLLAGLALEAFPMNLGYGLIKHKWNLVKSLDHPIEILILGDSSCHLGMDPEVFEEGTSERALNLCVIADVLAVNDYWMLDYYIRRFGAPKKVILSHVYNSWHRPLAVPAVAQIPMDRSFFRENIAKLELTWPERVSWFLGNYAPLYAENNSLMDLIMYPWRAARQLDWGFGPKGFAGMTGANPRSVQKNLKEHRAFLRTFKFSVSPKNRWALEKIIQMSNDHGFKLYLVNAAMFEGLYQDNMLRGYLSDMNKFFKELAKPSPNVHHLFVEPVLVRENELHDMHHINLDAARRFSRRVRDAIRQLEQEESVP